MRDIEMQSKVRSMTGPALRHRRLQRLRRLVLACSIVATLCLLLWVSLRVADFVMNGSWLAVGVGIGLGALAIDFVTGIVHWGCDRFGDATTPIVGPLLIRAFREHHDDPRAILDHDWIETNGEACFLTMLALIALAIAAPRAESGLEAGAVTFIWAMALLGAPANQAHKWAHMQRAPRIVRFLQHAGLTLRPGNHARHHSAHHDTAYCISTGWMNPLLDRLGLWSRLERSLKGTT